MIRLVIDTDPGVDDAHAIMAAFAYPKARVEAITTVAGNVSLEQTTANACTILDVLEQHMPVYAGYSRPVVGESVEAAHYHGTDGLGESSYPPSSRRVEDMHAVNALIRMAHESPGELTLVAIGPLTNVGWQPGSIQRYPASSHSWSSWGERFEAWATSRLPPSSMSTVIRRQPRWYSVPGPD